MPGIASVTIGAGSVGMAEGVRGGNEGLAIGCKVGAEDAIPLVDTATAPPG